MRRSKFLLPLVLAGMAGAQTTDPYQAVRTATEASASRMAPSVDRQKESVRRQGPPAPGDGNAFFTVAWPMPPGMELQAGPPDCDPIPESQLGAYIEQTARREGFTPDLLRAVIARESGFRPCAISSKGAQGLMQLMPDTAAELGVGDPFDPKANIDAGARYLSQLLARYGGDVALALGAYNAGPTRVDTYRGLPPIPETLNYVSDIMEKLRVQPVAAPPSP